MPADPSVPPPVDTAATALLHPAVVAAVSRALAWLYDVVQPDDAVQHHLGQSLLVEAANRRLGMHPEPATPTLTIAVARVEYGPSLWRPANPLGPGELDAFRAVVSAVYGRPVVGQWNGYPRATGSLLLADAPHPSLCAAVERYNAGCPAHGDVFCAGWQHAAGGAVPLASCEAWRAGFRRTVPPPPAADASVVRRG